VGKTGLGIYPDGRAEHDGQVGQLLMKLDDLGMIAAGKSADFVVLDANPLDDIKNTRRISKVYIRGKEVDRAAMRREFGSGS